MDAATQTHFAHPGNRFYLVLLAEAITRPTIVARG